MEVLHQIEELLRAERVISFFDRSIDPYQAILFRREQANHGTSTIALFDQNVLNDVIELVRSAVDGDQRPCSERGRFGAALMAFLQAANILIEPSIAIHEKKEHALRDLQLFRCADNVDAELYARLAIGELHRLPAESLPELLPLETEHDFSKKITGRSVFRAALLKIACLELQPSEPTDKMAEFLRWSFEDFCIARIPILLACAYFCPGRQSPMITGLRSPDRNRALDKIENALWDVQLIDNWTKRVTKQKVERKLWLLCSRDRAVHNVAGAICHANASPADLERVEIEFFTQYWGERNGMPLALALKNYQRCADDPRRLHHRDRSIARLAKMNLDMEQEILTWTPPLS